MPLATDAALGAWEQATIQRLLATSLPAVTHAFADDRCVMAVTVELDMGVHHLACQVTIWRRGIILPLHRKLQAEPTVHERFSWKIVDLEGTTWGNDPEWADEPDDEDMAAWVEDTGERPDRPQGFPRIGPKRGFLTPEAALRDAIADRHTVLAGTYDESDLEGATR